ncbi:recombinase family protein [Streptantibioticus rubrisoli]|uniref:Recombinase family protein n=1 Tax=Streptantibioticus rubrisoli TaxID=1387313 RepID=A0ABT1PAT1_9ACTN|nr:recombinase family protein [Streptantibioticus rubrisoli]MCQ4042456.1 recombinase family protein [Streptantibioticus rubrisoli]
MSDELIQRAQWGHFDGMNFAVLTRLSTEETEGEELEPDGKSANRYMTGRDIKSTAEQEKDSREFIEARGGRVVFVYTEPDTSAWKRRRVRLPDGRVAYRVVRPVFEGALGDLKAGRAPNGERVDGLIVYDVDRLTRDPRHLEDAIETVEHYHRPIIDITGTLDLLTDNGRAMARVIVAMANKQSADTSRRVKRKHKAMQQKGIPAGGTRPFGWKEDRRTVEPDQAKLIRDAAKRLIDGAPWYAIVAEWNEKGIVSAKGKKWSVRVLQEVMSNPRICGYRSRTAVEFNPETGTESWSIVAVYDDEGKPVVGQHQPILTVAEWQAITAILEEGPKRGSGHNARKYLLTGTLRCGKDNCGAKLRAMKAPPSHGKPEGHFYYMCAGKATGQGCGGVSIAGPQTDELVKKLLIAHHEEQAKRRQAVTAAEPWPKEEQLARVHEDIEDLKQARRNRQISAERYYRDLAEYEAEEQQLKKARNAWQRKALANQGRPIDIAKEWARPDITLAEKRAYVEQAFTAIVVLPVGKGSRVPLRERLVPLTAESD